MVARFKKSIQKDDASAPAMLQYVSLQREVSPDRIVAITAHTLPAEQWPYDKNPELLASGQYGVLQGQKVETQLLEFLKAALMSEGEDDLVVARKSRVTDWQQAQSIKPLPMEVTKNSSKPCCFASKEVGKSKGGLVIAGDYFTHASFMGAYASASGAADAVLEHLEK